MHRSRACHFAIVVALLPLFAACDSASGAEKQVRAKIVGDYVTEMSEGPVWVRRVLTLRPDSRWTWVTTMEDPFPETPDTSADSGYYRIQGVTLSLYSVIESGLPLRYTVSGDTLFGANAALTYAVTSYDIGESFLVRER